MEVRHDGEMIFFFFEVLQLSRSSGGTAPSLVAVAPRKTQLANSKRVHPAIMSPLNACQPVSQVQPVIVLPTRAAVAALLETQTGHAPGLAPTLYSTV